VSAVVVAVDLCKEYKQPDQTVIALADVCLSVSAGEFVALSGESGSGKSTLLGLLGAIDRPTRGSVRLLDKCIDSAPAEELARLRREHVGFVFQDFLLVRHLTALQNVRLPLLFSEQPGEIGLAARLLDRFGVGTRARHRPGALSRGEMQRVALARALVNRPQLLLADEPTANLDARNSQVIWDLLEELNREQGLTIVVATHNPELAARARRVIRLDRGRLVSDDVHT